LPTNNYSAQQSSLFRLLHVFHLPGNIPFQAGDTLNLVSGRRLEKRLRRPSLKKRRRTFSTPPLAMLPRWCSHAFFLCGGDGDGSVKEKNRWKGFRVFCMTSLVVNN